jgi:hypothetical protein
MSSSAVSCNEIHFLANAYKTRYAYAKIDTDQITKVVSLYFSMLDNLPRDDFNGSVDPDDFNAERVYVGDDDKIVKAINLVTQIDVTLRLTKGEATYINPVLKGINTLIGATFQNPACKSYDITLKFEDVIVEREFAI